MKVYIVYGVDGSYDDRVEYPIKCFDDRIVAENYMKHLSTHQNGNTCGVSNTRYYISDFQVENSF